MISGESLEVVLVETRTDSELDLDHVALFSSDPAAAARAWQAYGFAPAGANRVEVGGAYIELHASLRSDPGSPERPLLNHIGVLVDSVEEHIAEAEEHRESRSTRSSMPRTRWRSSSGGRTGSSSSTSSTRRRSRCAELASIGLVRPQGRRRGHGRSRRGGSGSGARRAGRRPREGRSLRRVDAAVERRDLAASVAGRVPGRVSRRRSSAAATT